MRAVFVGGVRGQRVLQEDGSGGSLQPCGGNQPAGRRAVHQDLHQRPHDQHLLHRRPGLQRDHGGRAGLHGASLTARLRYSPLTGQNPELYPLSLPLNWAEFPQVGNRQ